MATSLVELIGISKAFGPVVALENVNFEIHAGEIEALVGDNGAGKSTLIKIISGVFKPDQGETLVDGVPANIHTPEDAKRLGIETLYQDLGLVEALDTVANLYLGRELTHKSWIGRMFLDERRMRQEAKQYIEGLKVRLPSVRTKVRYLSGGQRQAVAVCRATAWGSRLVIMDEPTAALGVNESQKVLDLIKTLRDKGVAVLLVSHNLLHVLENADRICVMRHGRLVANVRSEEVDIDRMTRLITGADRSAAALGAGPDAPPA